MAEFKRGSQPYVVHTADGPPVTVRTSSAREAARLCLGDSLYSRVAAMERIGPGRWHWKLSVILTTGATVPLYVHRQTNGG